MAEARMLQDAEAAPLSIGSCASLIRETAGLCVWHNASDATAGRGTKLPASSPCW